MVGYATVADSITAPNREQLEKLFVRCEVQFESYFTKNLNFNRKSVLKDGCWFYVLPVRFA